MPAAVFDFIEIRKKASADFFAPPSPAEPHINDLYRMGTRQCGACPELLGELCPNDCAAERKKLTERDGVTVTVP